MVKFPLSSWTRRRLRSAAATLLDEFPGGVDSHSAAEQGEIGLTEAQRRVDGHEVGEVAGEDTAVH